MPWQTWNLWTMISDHLQTGFYLVKACKQPTSWTNNRAHEIIVHLSTKAEYMILSDLVCPVIWIQNPQSSELFWASYFPLTASVPYSLKCSMCSTVRGSVEVTYAPGQYGDQVCIRCSSVEVIFALWQFPSTECTHVLHLQPILV